LLSFLFFASPSSIAVASTGFAVLTPTPNVDARYLYYWVTRQDFTDYLSLHAKGAAYPAVSAEDIGSAEIDLPPLPLQQRIAGILSAYDDLIAINQRRIQLLEKAARCLYREWFVHLRFPGYESVPVKNGVPEGWVKLPLGELAPLNYGKSLKATDRQDGKIPVYGSSGIVGTHSQSLIDQGAIIVGRKGNVGSLYYSPVPCFPIDTVFFISPDHASYLLFLALHQLNFISSDAAIPGLNRNYAHSLPIIWPDAETRFAFEMKAGNLFDQIHNLTVWNAELKKARDLLLPKLMSGQIDVSRIPLPEDVTA